MNLTPQQRKERDAQRQQEASQAMKEHRANEKAFYDNFQRLKAERQAREAAGSGTSAQPGSK
ncbi:hypothetical protein JQ559_28760 [Bradyrhizobium viridifuturi]|jgi:hypothetical protein|uniref:hypothetical protein n=1 Tax=Bradyrhizobium TaxID=374 RepID=UPI0003986F21|nr:MULTISPECIES: hypothetical protein [Bradyrhizobium]ERF84091.1 MAG: UDPglucose 6-dehydrogenase [Bradyrhizobium sp. DFCI-1]OYU58367.1 MAG: hypothetical protein CFE30_31305 [Bradyrhizobium sp. PARBB1]PSO25238.1 hypothetical protein C7G43_15860 [Bradyrhizobium sp. MOS004]QRI70479.1 hypothetical protein JQ507_02765 [Bradyrhizobium sp. PSBB068]MBR1023265.1 hypothetical protein [Bradyrhizobium viridifuturi]